MIVPEPLADGSWLRLSSALLRSLQPVRHAPPPVTPDDSIKSGFPHAVFESVAVKISVAVLAVPGLFLFDPTNPWSQL